MKSELVIRLVRLEEKADPEAEAAAEPEAATEAEAVPGLAWPEYIIRG